MGRTILRMIAKRSAEFEQRIAAIEARQADATQSSGIPDKKAEVNVGAEEEIISWPLQQWQVLPPNRMRVLLQILGIVGVISFSLMWLANAPPPTARGIKPAVIMMMRQPEPELPPSVLEPKAQRQEDKAKQVEDTSVKQQLAETKLLHAELEQLKAAISKISTPIPPPPEKPKSNEVLTTTPTVNHDKLAAAVDNDNKRAEPKADLTAIALSSLGAITPVDLPILPVPATLTFLNAGEPEEPVSPPPPPATSTFLGKEKEYERIYRDNAQSFDRAGIQFNILMTPTGWLKLATTEGFKLAASDLAIGCPAGQVFALDIRDPKLSRFERCEAYVPHKIVAPPVLLGKLWEKAQQEARKRYRSGDLSWWVLYPPQIWRALSGVIWSRLDGKLNKGEAITIWYIEAQDGTPDVEVVRTPTEIANVK